MLEKLPGYNSAVAALNVAREYVRKVDSEKLQPMMHSFFYTVVRINRWDEIFCLYELEHADPRAAPKHRNKSHVPNYSNQRHGNKQ
jgi:hypothetical protein